MILVKRLSGSEFALNADLIERVEATPDTILVMVDGTRYIVENSVAEILDLIREDRAHLLARTQEVIEEAEEVRENS